uniref:Uncharacterized protein n=1 Tax=Candidatus Kentrum sp. MB TaxID=2138164 RepID=A0A450XQD8_9GAMM|nr:MAG: hypothetical protein BECKMB1821I_GA0114274_10251 [Candidatus Kentron sp. MB]VFK32677.1 MAG: hypothetical protein BECKMB1821G_GA0114241_11206 [Candidatus Kentron sp. MB]VFK77529.1 MAG: hypothetical protein BECKMB1821H_GA0114242_11556 [Candidatus Kentron sp. MB]
MAKFVFFCDADDCLFDSERLVGYKVVFPAMRRFQQEVCQRQLPFGMIYCWRTDKLVDEDTFCRNALGVPMLEMLASSADVLGISVSKNILYDLDIEKSLAICDIFQTQLNSLPGAGRMLDSVRDLGLFNAISVVSSSVLRQLYIIPKEDRP